MRYSRLVLPRQQGRGADVPGQTQRLAGFERRIGAGDAPRSAWAARNVTAIADESAKREEIMATQLKDPTMRELRDAILGLAEGLET